MISSDFQTVSTADGILPFVGSFVVYKDGPAYWDGYTVEHIPNGSSIIEKIHFGQISTSSQQYVGRSGKEIGYELWKLYKPKEVCNVNALIDSRLKRCPLIIRKATKEEVKFIKKEILKGEMKWTDCYNDYPNH